MLWILLQKVRGCNPRAKYNKQWKRKTKKERHTCMSSFVKMGGGEAKNVMYRLWAEHACCRQIMPVKTS
jgi:hypothetical protein